MFTWNWARFYRQVPISRAVCITELCASEHRWFNIRVRFPTIVFHLRTELWIARSWHKDLASEVGIPVLESELHLTEWETIIDDNQLYKCFEILKMDKTKLQVFWSWDFKNTLKDCLKPFSSSTDTRETAVADRPLGLTTLGNRTSLFKWKQFILSRAQRQTCRTEILQVSVQPTHSIYVLKKMLPIGTNWIQKCVREYFLAVWHKP